MSIPFGPTGEVVYNRTYSRTKPDGSKETWPETVRRVARGNLELVYGDPETWSYDIGVEYSELVHYMERFMIIPAGRHLWASGVKGRQYLFNCHVSGWGELLSDHFEFSFLRLMEGGGVGANYSSKHIARFGAPRRQLKVHIVCDPEHGDIEEMRPFFDKDAAAYVQNWVHVDDSREGWARALVHMINVAMSDLEWADGELVFDVSRVRPSGSELKTFGGTASGPAPFARMMLEVAKVLNRAHGYGNLTPLDAMEIDHAIAECVVSGGNRRSARMSIVHWGDPYIMNFIACKKDAGKHWTTNISVEVDDKFFEELANPGNSMAKIVHQAVVHGMLENGEPGYWNSSLAQKGEVGKVIATNPCGEIALEAWENCNLGHVNLDAFAPKPDGKGGRTRFDYEGMQEAHRLITRFLIRATYGDVNDPKQADLLARNRRIGVGHLGVQGFWAKLGVKYSEIPWGAGNHSMLPKLYGIVRQEARDYAFELRIPEPVKVTAVAPTGTIAKLPGVSEGIHPIYARYFERRIRFSWRDLSQANEVHRLEREGFKVEQDVYDESGKTAVVVFPTEDILVQQVRELGWPDYVVQAADEIGIEAMLKVQRIYQDLWSDNAVSYTVNIPAGTVSAKELARLLEVYLPYLKGTTVMVDESRPQAPYTRITKAEYDIATAKTVEDSTDENCASGACPIR